MFIFFYIADTLITDVKDMYKNPHIITCFYTQNQFYITIIKIIWQQLEKISSEKKFKAFSTMNSSTSYKNINNMLFPTSLY